MSVRCAWEICHHLLVFFVSRGPMYGRIADLRRRRQRSDPFPPQYQSLFFSSFCSTGYAEVASFSFLEGENCRTFINQAGEPFLKRNLRATRPRRTMFLAHLPLLLIKF